MNKTGILFFLSAAILISVLALSGCGISKEEHEKVVADLARTQAELKKAESRITELEAELEEALALPKTNAGLAEKLRSSQKKAVELSARLKSLTIENQDLEEKLKALQSQTGAQ